MIVTLNEVQRACQKAMSGAGAPPGFDDDAAHATVWLESRGLPALGALAGALERWAGDPSAVAVVETPAGGGARRVEAGGRAAAFTGPSLIDIAAARAARAEAPVTLKISDLADPRFLLPPADLLRRSGWAFRILWVSAGRAASAGASAGPETGLCLLGDWEEAPPRGPLEVSIECRRSDRASFEAGPPVTVGQPDLEARRVKTLAGGLSVDDALWRRLEVYVHRALVPSSPESRARGAGPATAGDNE